MGGRKVVAALFLLGGALTGGCGMTIRHTVPEPIHITVDVNIRVQEELKDFFDEIDTHE